MIDLSVVIPAYLEEENLRLLLPRVHAALTALQVTHEVLVVDTETPMDHTGDVCGANGAICVKRSGGNTYGCAVRTGIGASSGARVIFMDADGSHAPEFIADLYGSAGDADIVIASRYVEGGATENPGSLILMSRALNLLYTICLGIRCKDVSNSFKLYNGDRLRALTLGCENFDIVEEILVKYSLCCPNMRIIELPFVFKKRMFGQTKRNLALFVLSFAATLGRLVAIRVRHRLHVPQGKPAIKKQDVL